MAGTTGAVFSSVEALQFGWEKTKSNLRPLLTIGILGLILGLIQSALSRGGAGVLALIVWLAQIAVTMVWVRVALKLTDGQSVDLSRPAELLTGFLVFLGTSVLYCLVVIFGLVLLVVPGIIWGLKFGFSVFIAAEKKGDLLEAFRESNRLTTGVKLDLFVFSILVFLLNLAGAIVFGLGLLLTIPVTVIASSYIFRRLQSRSLERPEGHVDSMLPPPATAGAH